MRVAPGRQLRSAAPWSNHSYLRESDVVLPSTDVVVSIEKRVFPALTHGGMMFIRRPEYVYPSLI